MSFRSAAAAAVAACVLVPGCAGAQLLMEPNVSAKMALTIAETALAECGSRVSVAVVDPSGRVRVFVRAMLGRRHLGRSPQPTRRARSGELEWAQRTGTTSRAATARGVIPLRGGVPIKVGEITIGGVGLSGAPNGGPQEEACGKAGVAKVADQLVPAFKNALPPACDLLARGPARRSRTNTCNPRSRAAEMRSTRAAAWSRGRRAGASD